MVILKDGTTIGTLGGGDLEKRIIVEAGEAMEKERPIVASFALDRQKGGLDMMCGGTVEVYIEPLVPPQQAWNLMI